MTAWGINNEEYDGKTINNDYKKIALRGETERNDTMKYGTQSSSIINLIQT
jgi:hypothetical protein